MQELATLKIYTARGMSRENPFPQKRVLHLGCGTSKLPGSVGVDMLKLPGVDVVHDLDQTPWPFENGSFDIILAHSVLEHLSSVVDFMQEAHRVGKAGARLVVCVPYFRSVDSFDDPTHRHFFTARSMDYFLNDGNDRAGYRYSERPFKKIGFCYGWPGVSKNPFARVIKTFARDHSHFYDQYVSLTFPVKILVWELSIEK